MRIVVRIGGSVVASPLNSILITRYTEVLKALKKQGHEVIAVVGGGSVARDMISMAKKLGLTENNQDWLAIHVSRLIALFFVLLLGKVGCGHVPTSIEAAISCWKTHRIVVMGGLQPRMTTDTVAAMIGKAIHADLLIKASNVDGVYTNDPKKHQEARKIGELRFTELNEIFQEKQHTAGIHQVLDPEAIKILHEGKMKMVIVNGFKPENVQRAIKGKKIGTSIT